MKRNVFHLMALLVLALTTQVALGQAATPAPPGQISYQGYLTDANGAPLAAGAPRNYSVVFRIYDSSSGSGVRWAEQQVVTVDRGYFTVMLGSGAASTGFWTNNLTSIFSGSDASDRYLGITVTDLGSNEILPRLRLLASPYSFLAANAINSVSAAKLVTASGADLITTSGTNVTIAGSVAGSGAGLTDLNATQITTGTLADTRLSANVALRLGGNTFSGGDQLVSGNKLIVNGFNSIDTTKFTGLSLQYQAGSGEGAIMSSYDDGYGFLSFYTKSGGGQPITQRMMISKDGQVGIGTTTPGFPLTFANVLGDKLSLWGQSGNSFGFGIQNSLLQIHSDGSGSDIAFGYGSSGAMTETMRIKGNGNVGIGVGPSYKLDVNGDTYLRTSLGVGTSPLPGTVGAYIYGRNATYAMFVYGGATYAAYFSGNVYVAGTLSKSAGSFKIDHPQDPENKWLNHSFVESPDMMNVYNGNIVTDGNGESTVTLPSYFEALNKDFRYQLTVIGQFAQAIVGSEIVGNSFVIKTDKPNVKVSWQVTGIRHDAYANAHRIITEEPKVGAEIGTYAHPVEAGKPKSMGFTPERANPLK